MRQSKFTETQIVSIRRPPVLSSSYVWSPDATVPDF